MKEIDTFLSKQSEPARSCFLALSDIILSSDKNVTSTLKYGMPCFCYSGKVFCYLWTHKKYKQPYILFVEGKRLIYPELLQEKRSRMKILLIDPTKDFPIKKIEKLLKVALNLYKSGTIKI